MNFDIGQRIVTWPAKKKVANTDTCDSGGAWDVNTIEILKGNELITVEYGILDPYTKITPRILRIIDENKIAYIYSNKTPQLKLSESGESTTVYINIFNITSLKVDNQYKFTSLPDIGGSSPCWDCAIARLNVLNDGTVLYLGEKVFDDKKKTIKIPTYTLDEKTGAWEENKSIISWKLSEKEYSRTYDLRKPKDKLQYWEDPTRLSPNGQRILVPDIDLETGEESIINVFEIDTSSESVKFTKTTTINEAEEPVWGSDNEIIYVQDGCFFCENPVIVGYSLSDNIERVITQAPLSIESVLSDSFDGYIVIKSSVLSDSSSLDSEDLEWRVNLYHEGFFDEKLSFVSTPGTKRVVIRGENNMPEVVIWKEFVRQGDGITSFPVYRVVAIKKHEKY